ncbi:MAG: hypothetical protein ACJ780_13160 [Solirubrobacteraceae bacterium]
MNTGTRRTAARPFERADGFAAGLPTGRHLVALIAGVAGALVAWLYVVGVSPALAQQTPARSATPSAQRAAAHPIHKRHHPPKKRVWPRCNPHMPKFDVCESPKQGLAMGGIQDHLQSLLLSFAKDQLQGFILNQFGVNELTDPVGTKLNAITSQLGNITTQLATAQTSINTTYDAVVNTDLHTALNPLVTDVVKVFSLYNDSFAPAIRGEIRYAAAKAAVKAGSTCEDTEACRDARDDFFGTSERPGFRQAFVTAQAGASEMARNDTIHDYLIKTGERPAILTTYGTYLIAHSSGFLTRSTSDRLLAFYTYFADAEALATWMKAEYRAIEWGPDATGHVTPGHQDEFKRFLVSTITGDPATREQSYFQKELSSLPPLIPAHAVISLSPNSAERTTSNGRPMWLFDPQYTGIAQGNLSMSLTWDPTEEAVRAGLVEFADHGVPSVGHALKEINNARPGDFADWTVPSADEWKNLFAGWKTTKSRREFLGDMDPADPYWHSVLPLVLDSQTPYLWTRTAAPRDSKCLSVGTVLHLHAPTVVNTSVPLSDSDRAIGPVGPGAELYGANVSECYHFAWAQLTGRITGEYVPAGYLIATRNTGGLNYMADQ